MGLDMHLYKMAKVDGYTFEEMLAFERIVSHSPTQEEYADLPDDVRANVYNRNYFGMKLNTLQYEDMYWRKQQDIHQWFVQNVQDGKDDCRSYLVSKEQLEGLQAYAKNILTNHLEHLTPESYRIYDNTERAARMILLHKEFDTHHIFYCSSW